MSKILELFLTIFAVPETQNLSRSLIRTSNVDFFESFVKPKKFDMEIKTKNSDFWAKEIVKKFFVE